MPSAKLQEHSKTQEHAAIEKPNPNKPGRKPLTSEPKNKRTAQNRAAQRAFRERKEKRMKELEDKVLALEKERNQIANESELLRSQVKALMQQLNKNGNNTSIKLEDMFNTSQSINKHNSPQSHLTSSSVSDISHIGSSHDSNSSRTTPNSASDFGFDLGTNDSHPSTNSDSNTNPSINYNVEDTTPDELNSSNLQLVNKLNNNSFKGEYDESFFCKELNSACQLPVRSTTTGENFKIPNSITPITKKSSPDLNLPQSNLGSSSTPGLTRGMTPSITPNYNSIWNFSGATPASTVGSVNNNEMEFLFADDNLSNDTNNLIQHNPSAFMPDPNNINSNEFTESNDDDIAKRLDLDFVLDFDTEIANGDGEIDVFDDLIKLPETDVSGKKTPSNQNIDTGNNQYAISSGNRNTIDEQNNEDDDNEVVPDNTANLMQCSQIWERITTHPRFTDLDIDNLCDELRQKAKCSESGVVVDGSDVGLLLHKAIEDDHRKKQDDLELKIKKAALGSTDGGYLNGLW